MTFGKTDGAPPPPQDIPEKQTNTTPVGKDKGKDKEGPCGLPVKCTIL